MTRQHLLRRAGYHEAKIELIVRSGKPIKTIRAELLKMVLGLVDEINHFNATETYEEMSLEESNGIEDYGAVRDARFLQGRINYEIENFERTYKCCGAKVLVHGMRQIAGGDVNRVSVIGVFDRDNINKCALHK